MEHRARGLCVLLVSRLLNENVSLVQGGKSSRRSLIFSCFVSSSERGWAEREKGKFTTVWWIEPRGARKTFIVGRRWRWAPFKKSSLSRTNLKKEKLDELTLHNKTISPCSAPARDELSRLFLMYIAATRCGDFRLRFNSRRGEECENYFYANYVMALEHTIL